MAEFSREDIIKLLQSIESKFSVNDWKIDGICIWPIIRVSIYAKIWSRQKENREIAKCGAGLVKKYTNILGKFIDKNIFRIETQKRHVDAVFLNNTGCRRYVDGVWIDVFCDPIIAELEKRGMKSCVYEWNNSFVKSPVVGRSCNIQGRLNVLKVKSKLEALLFVHDCRFPDFEEINSELGYLLDEKEIIYQGRLIYNIKTFFLEKLKTIRPKLAFTTIYYNEISMGFTLACKELGAVTIDIQHGMQVGNNPAYTGWINMPTLGFELMPDVFLVRSARERENIKKWFVNGNVLISGDLWLNLWKSDSNEYVYRYDLMIRKWKGLGKKLILYTLDYDLIPQIMKDTIKDTSDSCIWFIRLHPADIQNLQKRKWELNGLDAVYELDCASKWPLHAWLRNVDLHITEYSGVVLEAEQFGVPSIVTSEGEKKLFEEHIRAGYARFANTKEEIIQLICKMKKKKPLELQCDDYITQLVDLGNVSNND